MQGECQCLAAPTRTWVRLPEPDRNKLEVASMRNRPQAAHCLTTSPATGAIETRHRRVSHLARGISILSLVVVAAAVALVVINRDSLSSPDDANAIQIVVPIGFAILGALVISRERDNALGWVSLAVAIAMAISGFTGQYTRYALVTEPGAPFAYWVPLLGQLAEITVYPAGLAALALLLTPNGRFVTPAWRWVAWAGTAVTAILVVFTATESEVGDPAIPNPAGIFELARLSEGPIGIGAFLAGLGVLLAAGASVAVRLRRATGEERLQLRWVAVAAGLAIVTNVIVTVVAILFLSESASEVVITIATTLGFGIFLPTAFAVAILRYRLYDLDLLLNRTVLYGAITVVLAAALFAANLFVQRVVESTFGQTSNLVTAALGVAAGMAFGPMRKAARPIVDHALPPRSRLTLLFTDIVQSTQMIVDRGDEPWRDLLVEYRTAVRREIARHRGREVNTAGDAFFAVFHRPIDAVGCAIAMRRAVVELGMHVRTGLHRGEVETRGEQVTGLAVHAAARVMALAPPDGILVTQAVADAIRGRISVRDAGNRELRGVPGRWPLFDVTEPAAT